MSLTCFDHVTLDILPNCHFPDLESISSTRLGSFSSTVITLPYCNVLRIVQCVSWLTNVLSSEKLGELFCVYFHIIANMQDFRTWMCGDKNVWLFFIIVVLETHWGLEDVHCIL